MNSSSSFKDKIVLITGAARGIGRATAIEFAKQEAKVIAVSRTENDLNDLQKEYPGNIEIWPFDITGDDFFKEMSTLKKLDICINNAGINRPKLIEDVDDETLDLMLNLNVRATFRTSKHAVKIMKILKQTGASLYLVEIILVAGALFATYITVMNDFAASLDTALDDLILAFETEITNMTIDADTDTSVPPSNEPLDADAPA
jgi:NADP-dependent 3-hydroxy acid dehydrogenase YdfG